MISYDKLRKLLKDKGIAIREFNKVIGCNSNNIMSGRVGTSTDTVEIMCKYLKCDVSDIIEWVDEEQTVPEKRDMTLISLKESFGVGLLNKFGSYRAASFAVGKGANYLQQIIKKGSIRKFALLEICEKLNLNAEDYCDKL